MQGAVSGFAYWQKVKDKQPKVEDAEEKRPRWRGGGSARSDPEVAIRNLLGC